MLANEPAEKDAVKKDSKSAVYAGLFVPGRGRRFGHRAKAKAKAKGQPKNGSEKKTKKTARLKKVKADPPAIEEIQSNVNRQGKGRAVVQQLLQKTKALDEEKFPDKPLFDSHSGKCRLKIECCQKTTWTEILASSHEYFKTLCLD